MLLAEKEKRTNQIMPTKHYVPWNPDSGDVTGGDPTYSNNLTAESRAPEESRLTGRRSTSGRKARGKYKTFNDRMDDLRRYKETHGHPNVTIPDDKSLAQFCANARYARKNPGKGMQLTDERIAAFAP